MDENWQQFETRKQDHLRLALSPQGQSSCSAGLDEILLIPEALPDLDFSEIKITQRCFSQELTPFLISSMTSGHEHSMQLNLTLARACAERGWLLGAGSQRRELRDPAAHREWRDIRAQVPNVCVAGNLGIAQLIQTSQAELDEILGNMGAVALFVHTNPLQEAIQAEGTPQFKGAWSRLEKLMSECRLPVILKEVGCGISMKTLHRLASLPLFAVDLAGLGGTHWGRLEGARAPEDSVLWQRGEIFADWGLRTIDILSDPHFPAVSWQVWASGGVRHGVDAAKLIAMGASRVGFAKRALEQAIQGPGALSTWMQQVEDDLKVAFFATGMRTPQELRQAAVWRFKK